MVLSYSLQWENPATLLKCYFTDEHCLNLTGFLITKIGDDVQSAVMQSGFIFCLSLVLKSGLVPFAHRFIKKTIHVCYFTQLQDGMLC